MHCPTLLSSTIRNSPDHLKIVKILKSNQFNFDHFFVLNRTSTSNFCGNKKFEFVLEILEVLFGQVNVLFPPLKVIIHKNWKKKIRNNSKMIKLVRL